MPDWSTPFLAHSSSPPKYALIILNQPFSVKLLFRLWENSHWHCCADGGANRLYDVLAGDSSLLQRYMPDLIKGDLDSIRPEVRKFYASQGVEIIEDQDLYSTDLMKCVSAIPADDCDLILLGGLSGRLDQTVHTLSYLHKIRNDGRHVFAVTDDNVAWVLDSGEHRITIDHARLGPTCGLLPLGISSTILSTSGLRWNLNDTESSFNGLVSTSNHLVPEEKVVWIKTSMPIWWCAELRSIDG